MDESIEIKNRRYDKIFNHITQSLTPYLKNKDIELSMVRTGVIIDDVMEIISLVASNSTTYATFTVERDIFKVITVNVKPVCFDKYFGIFELKDRNSIIDYLKSFEGLDLYLYEKEELQ